MRRRPLTRLEGRALDDLRGRIGLADAVEQVAETLPVLGHLDGLQRRAQERDAGALEDAARLEEFAPDQIEVSGSTRVVQYRGDILPLAKLLLERGLTLPGSEMVMKCSHAFNLLDARGAISTTERAGYIARVRALARAAAQAYYESRERLGFPMLKKPS